MNSTEVRYALSKQLSTAHTVSSSYGDIHLDDELRQAVDDALRPILQQRLRDMNAEQEVSQ